MDETKENDPRYEEQQLVINLPRYVNDEIKALEKQAHVPRGILIRKAYALAQLYYDEIQAGNKMVICDANDQIIKDVDLPD